MPDYSSMTLLQAIGWFIITDAFFYFYIPLFIVGYLLGGEEENWRAELEDNVRSYGFTFQVLFHTVFLFPLELVEGIWILHKVGGWARYVWGWKSDKQDWGAQFGQLVVLLVVGCLFCLLVCAGVAIIKTTVERMVYLGEIKSKVKDVEGQPLNSDGGENLESSTVTEREDNLAFNANK